RPTGLRASLPLKITSCMDEPRSIFALCSPRTQLIASPMFDLPHPLGPTTAVIPSGNCSSVRSLKDLKPASCIFSSLSIAGVYLRPPGGTSRQDHLMWGFPEEDPLDVGLAVAGEEEVG